MQTENSREVAWKMSENHSFPASLLCAKMQKHMLAPYFLLFFFKVEKLAPVRLLPALKATSLVMVKSFAISKENWGGRKQSICLLPKQIRNCYPLSFLSFNFFFLNTVFRIKISFLNYCYYWHSLMLLFSVPDKEILERGKILYLTQLGNLELRNQFV